MQRCKGRDACSTGLRVRREGEEVGRRGEGYIYEKADPAARRWIARKTYWVEREGGRNDIEWLDEHPDVRSGGPSRAYNVRLQTNRD